MVTGSKRTSRPRKRHVQMEMLDKTGTKPMSEHGGKRAGAGRPPKGARAGSPHKKRIAFKASQPLHVGLRVLPEMGRLRRRTMYNAIRKASIVAAVREDFRIIHLSIQGTHLHLIVEAENKTALARGMKSFEISAAKHMNAAMGGRRGQVFVDRYHVEIITSPLQARRALAYVLNNWRKHREDRDAGARTWLVDPFSSGWCFGGWKQRAGHVLRWNVRETYEPLCVWTPRTWLLREGWRRHGLIDCYEVPSQAPTGRKRRSRQPDRVAVRD